MKWVFISWAVAVATFALQAIWAYFNSEVSEGTEQVLRGMIAPAVMVWIATVIVAIIRGGWIGVLSLGGAPFALIGAAFVGMMHWACTVEGACP